MTVNFAHLHLLLNHFPIIGFLIGLALFLVSFFGSNEDLRRSSLIIFVAVGLLGIAAFLTGFGALAMIGGKPGVSDALIQRHEGAARCSPCGSWSPPAPFRRLGFGSISSIHVRNTGTSPPFWFFLFSRWA